MFDVTTMNVSCETLSTAGIESSANTMSRHSTVMRHSARIVITILALCLITVEWRDIVFALDSIPAVLSVSQETFIVVTSNIFAILGLRSLYFVLAGMMAKFEYLELALGVLLVGIGLKMFLHNHVHITHIQSLLGIAVILSTGV